MTCDDFAQAIADANPDSQPGRLVQFKRWYAKPARRAFKPAGSTTPRATPTPSRSASSCGRHAGQPAKEPLSFRCSMGLWRQTAATCPALEGEAHAMGRNTVLVLTEAEPNLHLRAWLPSRCRRCCAASRPRWCWRPNSATKNCDPAGARSDPSTIWEAGQRLALRRRMLAAMTQITATSSWMPSLSRPAMRRAAPPSWMPPSRSWC